MSTKRSHTSLPTDDDLARALDKLFDALQKKKAPRPPSRPESVEVVRRFLEELARELPGKKGR